MSVYDELQQQQEAHGKKRIGNYPLPPVLVNLAGKQDFMLATVSINFRRIKDGKALLIPNNSSFSITFPQPHKAEE